MNQQKQIGLWSLPVLVAALGYFVDVYDLLLFTIAPLAMITTAHIEMPQQKLNQELALGVLILCSLFCFFSQL